MGKVVALQLLHYLFSYVSSEKLQCFSDPNRGEITSFLINIDRGTLFQQTPQISLPLALYITESLYEHLKDMQ